MHQLARDTGGGETLQQVAQVYTVLKYVLLFTLIRCDHNYLCIHTVRRSCEFTWIKRNQTRTIAIKLEKVNKTARRSAGTGEDFEGRLPWQSACDGEEVQYVTIRFVR